MKKVRDINPEWAERLGCFLANYAAANGGQLPPTTAAPWSQDVETLERTLRHDFSRAASSLFKVGKGNWSLIQDLETRNSGLRDDMMECHHHVTNLDNVVARLDTDVANLTKRISELEAAKSEASRAERPELTKLDDGNYVDASRVTCVEARWSIVDRHWHATVYSSDQDIYESDACGSKDEAQKLRDRIAVVLCTGLG